MPIIPTVGRRYLKTRLVLLGLYTALVLGAITMIFPFLTMLTTGMKSSVDQNDGRIIPAYLRDRRALFAKYAEDKYADSPDEINFAFGTAVSNAAKVELPTRQFPADLVAKWDEFVAGLKAEDYSIGFRVTVVRPTSLLNEKYQEFCIAHFHNDLTALNARYTEENAQFQTLEPPIELLHRRDFQFRDDQKTRDWLEFKPTLPAYFRIPVRADRVFQEFLKIQYNGDIKKLNAAWKTDYLNIQQIPFGAEPPNAAARADWVQCLRERMPYRYLLIKGADGKFHNALAGVDLTDYKQRTALETRVQNAKDDELAPATLEMEFAQKAGVKPTDLIGIQEAADWKHVQQSMGELRTDFATRNYRYVLNYILLHGRAVWVTVIFCAIMVLSQLIVNPLCAYALSRFPMRSTGRILLFLLATMAFPAEVAMIPSFLLLKNFNMLNTFWALVLPGVASGYAIFLLKGFFDSLPRELYEAGTMDGASEMTMFRRVALPLSKPVFAVIALQAFLGAYGAFMYAFLVCQDQKMWTVMVWLYELQVRAPKFVTMAALTISAIPTLLVFLFAQNVIMRGIILPTEK